MFDLERAPGFLVVLETKPEQEDGTDLYWLIDADRCAADGMIQKLRWLPVRQVGGIGDGRRPVRVVQADGLSPLVRGIETKAFDLIDEFTGQFGRKVIAQLAQSLDGSFGNEAGFTEKAKIDGLTVEKAFRALFRRILHGHGTLT